MTIMEDKESLGEKILMLPAQGWVKITQGNLIVSFLAFDHVHVARIFTHHTNIFHYHDQQSLLLQTLSSCQCVWLRHTDTPSDVSGNQVQ